jgi:hypothetical protein
MEATGMDPMQRHILETSYEDNRGQPGSFNALATFLFHSLYPMIVRFNYVPGT